MVYHLQIVVPPVPEDDDAAFEFMFSKLKILHTSRRPIKPIHSLLNEFHDRITSHYPCPSSYPPGDPKRDHSPWADAPLIKNFGDEVGMLSLVTNLAHVLQSIVEVAHHLNLTVFDEQSGKIYRPWRYYKVILNGTLAGFSRAIVANKLAPLFNRPAVEVIDILRTERVTIKRQIEFKQACGYVNSLRKLGCLAMIESERKIDLLQSTRTHPDLNNQSSDAALAKRLSLPPKNYLIGQTVLRLGQEWRHSETTGQTTPLVYKNDLDDSFFKVSKVDTVSIKQSFYALIDEIKAKTKLRWKTEIYPAHEKLKGLIFESYSIEYIDVVTKNNGQKMECRVIRSGVKINHECFLISMRIPERIFRTSPEEYRARIKNFLVIPENTIRLTDKNQNKVSPKPVESNKAAVTSQQIDRSTMNIRTGQILLAVACTIMLLEVFRLKAFPSIEAVMLIFALILFCIGGFKILSGIGAPPRKKVLYGLSLVLLPVFYITTIVLWIQGERYINNQN